MKSTKPAPLIKLQLVMIEKQLCDSHLDEKLFDENAAVTKIKEDPNYFFRYAKKFSIYYTDIGPLVNSSTNSLSNGQYEMCRLLEDQFTSVFTIPDPNKLFLTQFRSLSMRPTLTLTNQCFNRYHAKRRYHN